MEECTCGFSSATAAVSFVLVGVEALQIMSFRWNACSLNDTVLLMVMVMIIMILVMVIMILVMVIMILVMMIMIPVMVIMILVMMIMILVMMIRILVIIMTAILIVISNSIMHDIPCCFQNFSTCGLRTIACTVSHQNKPQAACQ
jgi:hypothetical protein